MSRSESLPFIKFAGRHIEPIKTGEKTATVRYDFEREVKSGQPVQLMTPGMELITESVVESCTQTTIGDVVHQGVKGHVSYDTIEELIAELETYYTPPEGGFDAQTELTEIHWRS